MSESDVISIDSDENDINLIDVEDHLFGHTITKPNIISSKEGIKLTKNNAKQTHFEENIPILINDLKNVQLNKNIRNFNVSTIYNINFRTLTIYGRAIPLSMRIQKKLDKRKYSIDDGTGNVTVYYTRNYKKILDEIEYINKLSHEIDLLRKDFKTLAKNKKNIGNLTKDSVESMQCILNKIKKNSKFYVNYDNEFFKGIHNVSVIGIPFKCNRTNEICISAFEMLEDNGCNRDKEIVFKNSLIQFYENVLKK